MFKDRGVRLTAGDYVFYTLNGLVFFIFTILCVFPFYYLFINTISDNALVAAGQINFIPRGIHIQNYVSIFNVPDIGQALYITTMRTVIGTAIMVLASGFVGYLVTQQKMLMRKWVYRFIIVTMYFNAGLIPWFLNMSMLGLTNNFWGYVIPLIVQPFNIILVKTYVESLPAEMEESALIDGAGYFTVYRKIILPLCKPILATIGIFGAVGHWNSLMDSMILMLGEPRLYTLQHRLWIYLDQASDIGRLMGGRMTAAELDMLMSARNVSLTVAMVSIVPILLVYPFMQRYFQKGIMLGAIKG
ncbi:MAG: carbohydrate ABC transporter permease [Defluviitaleaceae bacterium]|nr:carbohydrate ABC transporter permease [Defluviitaleaceae bacterium]